MRPVPTERHEDYIVTMYDLEEDVCRQMLSGSRFGRVAFDDADGPVALPINALFAHDRVLFRTLPESLIDRAVRGGGRFAYEVDHADSVAESGWSVLVRGPAGRVTDAAILAAVADTDVHPWAPAARNLWIEIRAEQITGRVIRRHRLAPDPDPLPYMPPD